VQTGRETYRQEERFTYRQRGVQRGSEKCRQQKNIHTGRMEDKKKDKQEGRGTEF
jgi:hypothetical protein